MRGQRQLLWDPHKQRAGQFAGVVGVVVSTKNGRGPGVGVFFDQGFVCRAALVKFCTDRGLSGPPLSGLEISEVDLNSAVRRDRRAGTIVRGLVNTMLPSSGAAGVGVVDIEVR